MNLDPHWLKETHKDFETEALANLSYRAYMFGDEGGYATLKAEIERREKEANEHHKPML